jgi:hypothetical protein
MSANQNAQRAKELAEALANNPWVPTSVRETCRNLTKKWAREDSAASKSIRDILDPEHKRPSCPCGQDWNHCVKGQC